MSETETNDGLFTVWGTLAAVSLTAVVAASHRRVGIFGAFEQEYDQHAREKTLFKGAHWLGFQHDVKRRGHQHAMENDRVGWQR